jgi:asparaginyl-tRNA synthetase
MHRQKISKLSPSLIDTKVTCCGWVRTLRNQKNFSFIELYDGSCFGTLQIIITDDLACYPDLIQKIATGTSIRVEGIIVKSPKAEQAIEMKGLNVEILGDCPADTYPLQKKRHSFEFLRTIAHLRSRTNTQGAINRLRNTLAFAIHRFFQEKGFYYVQTPLLTSSDCEGGGEQFVVTTQLKADSQDKLVPIDYKKDFFEKPTYLTVSGQLNGETLACALGDIYTFGPTFRAENSNTSRHLAEFWMIEPEMAFANLEDNIQLAQDFLKFITHAVLTERKDDLAFFDQHIQPGLIQKLEDFHKTGFKRMTYTEACDILMKSGQTFDYPVSWGLDLQSEHERYLCEKVVNGPLVLTDYPRAIKAFYMRDNPDGKTVAAMDVLVPGVGEIIGGSQREERYDKLEAKIKEFGLLPESYSWYLDLRRYGSVPHAGFGAGFERLVQYFSGIENIRDAIPFPRYPGHAEF